MTRPAGWPPPPAIPVDPDRDGRLRHLLDEHRRSLAGMEATEAAYRRVAARYEGSELARVQTSNDPDAQRAAGMGEWWRNRALVYAAAYQLEAGIVARRLHREEAVS